MEQNHFAMLGVNFFLEYKVSVKTSKGYWLLYIPATHVDPHQVQSHTPPQNGFRHQGDQLCARSRWTADVRPTGLGDGNHFSYAQARSDVADRWETAELDVFLGFRNVFLHALDTGLEEAYMGVAYNELDQALVLAPWLNMVSSYSRVCWMADVRVV